MNPQTLATEGMGGVYYTDRWLAIISEWIIRLVSICSLCGKKDEKGK